MSRHPKHPRRLTRWWPGATLVVLAAGYHPTAAGATDIELLPPTPLVRKFPESPCPLPITLQFTATGSYATFHAEANVYVASPDSLIYTGQALDNVALVPTAVHQAHYVPNVEYSACYLSSPVDSLFEFDQVSPPGSVPLIETFESGAPSWDLANGAYHDTTRSAHLDPSNTTGPHVEGQACLGLGQRTASPSLGDVGRTSITVNGLTAGVSYTISGWWLCGGGIFPGPVTLTLKVTGPEPTATDRATWGMIKHRYR